MKKTTARASLAAVLILQSGFLAAIWIKAAFLPEVMLLLALITLLTVLAWRSIPHHRHDHLWEDTWLILFVTAGAVTTYGLSIFFYQQPIFAAGSVGVLASFIPTIWRHTLLARQIPPAIYCGAFVGMTSPEVAGDYTFIILAATSAGVLLVLSKNVFHGYGGKLGTVAFGGVVLMSVLMEWWRS